MSTCSILATGLDASNGCNQPIGGTASDVILMNYDDINRTLLVKASGAVTDLILKSTKVAYKFETTEDANTGSFTFAKGRFFGMYDHSVVMRDFVGNKAAHVFLDSLKGARVVAIVENKHRGTNGESKYKIYGLDAGLILTGDTGTTELTDGIIGEITLASSEMSKEPSRPICLYDTSEVTTDAIIAALLVPAT